MPTYRMIGTAGLKRMQFTEETRYEENGTPYIHRYPAPDEVIARGDLFGPSPEEISAFGDLMEFVSDEPFNPPQSLASAPPTRINPELFSLIRRAHAGEASGDEQNITADVTRYLEAHAQGTASAEETAALELVLKDFGMPLFVV